MYGEGLCDMNNVRCPTAVMPSVSTEKSVEGMDRRRVCLIINIYERGQSQPLICLHSHKVHDTTQLLQKKNSQTTWRARRPAFMLIAQSNFI